MGEQVQPAPRSRRRILVVEDDRASAEALARILSRLEYDVTTAATVHDAIKRLPGHDFLVLDLMLPDGEGADLMAQLERQARRVRIAVTTSARMDSAVVQRAQRLKPEVVLQKPISLNQLLEWLNRP
jgi:CheY-like chemotaxis protein